MREELRRSWPSRITAFGFIVEIILGNLWLAYLVTGNEPPAWMQKAFVVGAGIVVAGGLGLLGVWLALSLRPPVRDE